MAANGGGYSYSFSVDRTKINGDQYYRLKIVDKDGKYTYSKVLLVSFGQIQTISITPTLVYSSMSVTLPTSGRTQVSVYNAFGQLVKSSITETEKLNMDVSSLTRGEYFLRVIQGKNSYSAKFLKQ